MRGLLEKIELDYPVEKIQINGEPFWPFFRALIYSELNKDVIQVYEYRIGDVIRRMFEALKGFTEWFRPHKYLIFSNELERKIVNGKVIDKLNEKAIELLGHRQCLYIEQVSKSHLPLRQYGAKRVASQNAILFLTAVVRLLRRHQTVEIQGEDIIQAICHGYNLTIDYQSKLNLFFAKVHAVRLLLRLQKPKVIFVSDYGLFFVCYAAKHLGIVVTEFQHGLSNIDFYHPAKPLNPAFCPNFMLVFGAFDKTSLSHGRYVASDRIYAIGNYYLEIIAQQKENDELTPLMAKFKNTVCIPTSLPTHDYLTSFAIAVAPNLPETLFIVVPRNVPDAHKRSDLPFNVHIEMNHSFQEVSRHCTFNTCTYSTCSIEALSLGVQNILIDEDGQTSQYLGSVLKDTRFTRFVKTREQYIETVRTFEVQSKQDIQNSNFLNYVPDYEHNLTAALTEITK